jgi:hypothetical protein
LNLGHLRAFLATAEAQALPDETPVGIEGHYGELCKFCDDTPAIKTLKRASFDFAMATAIILPHVDAGPQPD